MSYFLYHTGRKEGLVTFNTEEERGNWLSCTNGGRLKVSITFLKGSKEISINIENVKDTHLNPAIPILTSSSITYAKLLFQGW